MIQCCINMRWKDWWWEKSFNFVAKGQGWGLGQEGQHQESSVPGGGDNRKEWETKNKGDDKSGVVMWPGTIITLKLQSASAGSRGGGRTQWEAKLKWMWRRVITITTLGTPNDNICIAVWEFVQVCSKSMCVQHGCCSQLSYLVGKTRNDGVELIW